MCLWIGVVICVGELINGWCRIIEDIRLLFASAYIVVKFLKYFVLLLVWSECFSM